MSKWWNKSYAHCIYKMQLWIINLHVSGFHFTSTFHCHANTFELQLTDLLDIHSYQRFTQLIWHKCRTILVCSNTRYLILLWYWRWTVDIWSVSADLLKLVDWLSPFHVSLPIYLLYVAKWLWSMKRGNQSREGASKQI